MKGIAFLQDGKIVNTGYRDPIVDFSSFPLPDFSLVHHAKISLYPVERIRGCGMECEFCTVKGRPRPSPPERLMSQISRLAETRKARKFFIVDDLFGQQREETLRFCRMLADYKERLGLKLDFTAQIRLDKGHDSELLTAMRNAGINTVAIGFESPVREDLETMNKHLRQQEMVSLVKAYRKHGFFIHGMFIFGYPSLEKPQGKDEIPMKERIKAFREFIKKHVWTPSRFFFLFFQALNCVKDYRKIIGFMTTVLSDGSITTGIFLFLNLIHLFLLYSFRVHLRRLQADFTASKTSCG